MELGVEVEEEFILLGQKTFIVDRFKPSITRGTIGNVVHRSHGNYSSKSAYEEIKKRANSKRTSDGLLKKVWCRSAPSKASAFAWKLLLNKIPTRQNLKKRGVIRQMDDDKCPLCCFIVKISSVYFFFSCEFAFIVWTSCYSWFGLDKKEMSFEVVESFMNLYCVALMELPKWVWCSTRWQVVARF